MSTKSGIGERIKEKRKTERLSAEDLAIKLNINRANVYKWERGSKPSDPEEYKRLIDWLNKGEDVPQGAPETKADTGGIDLSNLNTSQLIEALISINKTNQVIVDTAAQMALTQDKMAITHDKVVDTNRLLASNLVAQMKENAIASGDSQTIKELVSTVSGLREYTEKIISQLTKTPKREISQAVGKEVMEAKKKVENTGIPVDGSKQSKTAV